RDMIAPAVGYWIELFARYFKRIEVLRWPHDPPFLPIARRNLLLSDKREPGDDRATELIEHPVPPLDGGPGGPADPTTTADARERGERRGGPQVEPPAPAPVPAIVT